MKLIVCENYDEMSLEGAKIIADLLKNKPDCILGLATGSTPVGMYKELAKMNKAGEISFKDVTSYNLDEYYPLAPDHDQSYRYFMNQNLFNNVDIDIAKTHVPDGLAEDPAAMGAAYDAEIEAAGGIPFTGIINNSNIGPLTTAADVLASRAYAEEVAAAAGIPLVMTTVRKDLYDEVAAELPRVVPLDLQQNKFL